MTIQRTHFGKVFDVKFMEMVKLLLQHGADPAVRDEDGVDAFMIAREKKHKELLQLLQSKVPAENKK